MAIMLNSTRITSGEHPATEVFDFAEMQPSQPYMIVLQPEGILDRFSSPAFQKVLEDSLAQVAETVIVDLLWIEATDLHGISALVAGIQRAAALGKSLSFKSMDGQTRLALESEWNRQWEISFGPWNELFEQDLERFLKEGKKA